MKKLIVNKIKTSNYQLISCICFVSLLLVSIIILIATIRGNKGNPTASELNTTYWKDEGPLELSPERGRFGLTYSLVEDNSYFFSNELARFVLPDLAELNGKYVSLFAPTVSYFIMPGYVIGKFFGLSQVGSFTIIALFAFINMVLIRSIAIKLGAHPWAAQLAGFLFLFASPAFAYSITLYQHQISTFIILLSIYTLIRWKSYWYLTIVWFLCGLSISIDNPNLIMMIPIGIFALARLVNFQNNKIKIGVVVNFKGILLLAIMILPLLFFCYFNYRSYGNPFQLAGTVATGNVDKLLNLDQTINDGQLNATSTGILKKNSEVTKNSIGFFETRNLPIGLYENLISQDRGMLFFTPIMVAGFFGLIVLYRKNLSIGRLILSIIGVNILLYSMWGDPYGGWAFGSRYLIPTYALISILLSLMLTQWRKKLWVLLILLGLSLYSIGVNTIGAVTSGRNPPKIEILNLEAITKRQERYSFDRNIELLNSNLSKSFIYNTYLKSNISAWVFTYLLMSGISFVVISHFIVLYITRHD